MFGCIMDILEVGIDVLALPYDYCLVSLLSIEDIDLTITILKKIRTRYNLCRVRVVSAIYCLHYSIIRYNQTLL